MILVERKYGSINGARKQLQTFQWYRDFLKRILDVLFGSIGIIVFAVPMLFIALLIKLESPKEKVMFKQVRVGKSGNKFVILKFRTMNQNAPHHMATENFDDAREYITKVGRILRKSSLDELPQLFNVVKGEMSLIGPRPLIPDEKNILKWRKNVNADLVLPGITGLAQVNGRDNLNGKSKVKYDRKYVENLTFTLDIKIFLKTIYDVVHSKGIRN